MTMDDPLKRFPGYVLRRASNAAMADIARAIRPLSLRPVEASLLVVVAAQPGWSQSDIGRLLGIKRANMTPLVGGLERRALLHRQKVDGRSRALVLTARGAAVAEKVRDAFEECERSFLRRIPVRHQESFLKALYALWDDGRGP
jgi:DNA-binding MarR family transcriptional regulator